MIQVLAGEKGSGKTKKMISLANDLITQSKGHVVYISTNSEVMFDVDSHVRLVDLSQFPISCCESFVGFLHGVISQDYDIEAMFIDNLNSILKDDNDSIQKFFNAIKSISREYNIKLFIGIRTPALKIEQPEVEYIAV